MQNYLNIRSSTSVYALRTALIFGRFEPFRRDWLNDVVMSPMTWEPEFRLNMQRSVQEVLREIYKQHSDGDHADGSSGTSISGNSETNFQVDVRIRNEVSDVTHMIEEKVTPMHYIQPNALPDPRCCMHQVTQNELREALAHGGAKGVVGALDLSPVTVSDLQSALGKRGDTNCDVAWNVSEMTEHQLFTATVVCKLRQLQLDAKAKCGPVSVGLNGDLDGGSQDSLNLSTTAIDLESRSSVDRPRPSLQR